MGFIRQTQPLAVDDGAWAVVNAAMGEGAEALFAGVEFLHKRVNACQVMAANAHIRLIKSVMSVHGGDYELAKHAEWLAAGGSLDRTRAWLSATIKSYTWTPDATSQLDNVITIAMLDLATGTFPLTDGFPELLRHDEHDLRGMRALAAQTGAPKVVWDYWSFCIDSAEPINVLLGGDVGGLELRVEKAGARLRAITRHTRTVFKKEYRDLVAPITAAP